MKLITATPNPVQAGGYLTVCYGILPHQGDVDIEVSMDFKGGEEDTLVFRLSVERPCICFQVPSDCLGITISDPSGLSDPVVVTVTN